MQEWGFVHVHHRIDRELGELCPDRHHGADVRVSRRIRGDRVRDPRRKVHARLRRTARPERPRWRTVVPLSTVRQAVRCVAGRVAHLCVSRGRRRRPDAGRVRVPTLEHRILLRPIGPVAAAHIPVHQRRQVPIRLHRRADRTGRSFGQSAVRGRRVCLRSTFLRPALRIPRFRCEAQHRSAKRERWHRSLSRI